MEAYIPRRRVACLLRQWLAHAATGSPWRAARLALLSSRRAERLPRPLVGCVATGPPINPIPRRSCPGRAHLSHLQRLLTSPPTSQSSCSLSFVQATLRSGVDGGWQEIPDMRCEVGAASAEVPHLLSLEGVSVGSAGDFMGLYVLEPGETPFGKPRWVQVNEPTHVLIRREGGWHAVVRGRNMGHVFLADAHCDSPDVSEGGWST